MGFRFWIFVYEKTFSQKALKRALQHLAQSYESVPKAASMVSVREFERNVVPKLEETRDNRERLKNALHQTTFDSEIMALFRIIALNPEPKEVVEAESSAENPV